MAGNDYFFVETKLSVYFWIFCALVSSALHLSDLLCPFFFPKGTVHSEPILSENWLVPQNGNRTKQNTYPGYKELIGTEFIQPLIQEVKQKRQHVMPCMIEAEKVVSQLTAPVRTPKHF